MKRIIQQIIRLRNPLFTFDAAVGTDTLIQFVWIEAWNFLRGLRVILFLRRPKGMLLARRVRFFNMSKIRWGRFVKLGENVWISALGKEGVTVGNHVGIGAFSRVVVSTSLNNIGAFIRIGHHVSIGEYAYLGGGGGLEIGNETIVGQYFSCHPENHIYDDELIPIRRQGVTRKGINIGNNCWIGSKVTVLDGVTIGNGCIVAAGAVVTQSFPDNVIIGGVPARFIKQKYAQS